MTGRTRHDGERQAGQAHGTRLVGTARWSAGRRCRQAASARQETHSSPCSASNARVAMSTAHLHGRAVGHRGRGRTAVPTAVALRRERAVRRGHSARQSTGDRRSARGKEGSSRTQAVRRPGERRRARRWPPGGPRVLKRGDRYPRATARRARAEAVSMFRPVPWRKRAGQAAQGTPPPFSPAPARRGAENGDYRSITESGAAPWPPPRGQGAACPCGGARTAGAGPPCVHRRGGDRRPGNHPACGGGWSCPSQTARGGPAPRGSLVPSPGSRGRPEGGRVGGDVRRTVEGEALRAAGTASSAGRRAGLSGMAGLAVRRGSAS